MSHLQKPYVNFLEAKTLVVIPKLGKYTRYWPFMVLSVMPTQNEAKSSGTFMHDVRVI